MKIKYNTVALVGENKVTIESCYKGKNKIWDRYKFRIGMRNSAIIELMDDEKVELETDNEGRVVRIRVSK